MRTDCVICGRTISQGKERRYTPKPDDPRERYDLYESACMEHFL